MARHDRWFITASIMLLAILITGPASALSDLDQALLQAVQQGNATIVRDLIKQGAEVNARDETGNTALHYVAQKKIAELLITAGAHIDAVDDDFKMTPLFNAAVDIAALLIKNGADVNWRARRGMTPLIWAVYWEQKEKMALLIANGALVNVKDDDGKSPLHVAANWDHFDLVDFLIANGADVNSQDNECWTPLHWAAFEASVTTMDRLLAAGAKPNALSCPGPDQKAAAETPLDVARRFRSPDVIVYLKSRGCVSASQ